ncbi:DNA polymerase III subunit alpha [Mycoplasma elephantis]|uniref:DNA polymerase III subunit alpha n=1 Tax=Mycoplasma elephantis TaxID=114882 RepID=UPI00068B1CBE|nr:DNA polymerase III subunit alpha [Mycoplasma elephantis]
MKQFINLHTNTEYSFLESTIRINELIDFAIKNGLEYLAVTEHNNFFSLGEFVNKCIKNNIKPIIGIDLDVEEYRVIILPKNKEGYLFIKELSFAKSLNKTITFSGLNSDDVFYLDHPTFGFYKKNKKMPKIKNEDLYFYDSNNKYDKHAIVLRENIIIKDADNLILDVLRKIKGSELIYKGTEFQTKIDYDAVIVKRTNNIAAKCIFENEKLHFDLPVFKNDKNMSSFDYLKYLTLQKFAMLKSEFSNFDAAKNRLFNELNVISSLNFSDYFLIIQDLVKWAKSKNIEIGPGRGSAAGSLVSYLLGITKINPLDYGLLFERFLNKDRVTMPDIDIDIQDNRRNEVLEYMQNKYGHEHFALITTFQTLGIKSSIRDVARIMNVDLAQVNIITGLIGANSTFDDVEKNNKLKLKIKQFNNINQWETILEIVKELENRPRQISTHAAGIVLGNKPIINNVPIWLNSGSNTYPQTQISMDFLETYGLIKIDLLGLKNLTIINQIEEYLKINNVENDFDFKKDDPRTFSLLNKGMTLGIFQLESPGMRQTIKKVNITKFSDIYDIISLFRPGPMQNIPKYIENRSNKESSSISPEYDEILKSTYGIIVYQEQIMEICQKIANMSLQEADLFRRAISKKKADELQTLKSKFVNGAINNNYSKETSLNIYEQIEHFADYGFNKSHAVCYAYIAYKLAYYKSRYPLYFYASLINSFISSQDKVNMCILELESVGIKINSPIITHLDDNVLIKNNELTLPIKYINGLGGATSEKIKLKINKESDLVDFPSFINFCTKSNIGNSNTQKLIESNTLRIFGNVKTLEMAFLSIQNKNLEKNNKSRFGAKNNSLSRYDIQETQANSMIFKEFEEDFDIFDKYQQKYFQHNFENNKKITPFKYKNNIFITDIKPNIYHRMIIKIENVKIINKTKILKLITFSDGMTSSQFWLNSEHPFFNEIQEDKYYEVEITMSQIGNIRVTKKIGDK